MDINSLFSLTGKTALVTGGSRGIGLMIARGLVAAGVKTYIASRKAEVCERAAAELSKAGECIALPFDLGTSEGVGGLAEAIAGAEKSLDILVNNAGATWGAPLGEFPEQGWDKVVDLNLKSPFFLTQALTPLLDRAGTADDPARVINIGSIDGLKVSAFDNFSYGASKAGLHHLTRVLAAKLAPRHITVNAIAPGPFETKMMAWALDADRAGVERSVPRGRIGLPEDIAGTVIYLSARAGAFVTGAVIPVDGGLSTTR